MLVQQLLPNHSTTTPQIFMNNTAIIGTGFTLFILLLFSLFIFLHGTEFPCANFEDNFSTFKKTNFKEFIGNWKFDNQSLFSSAQTSKLSYKLVDALGQYKLKMHLFEKGSMAISIKFTFDITKIEYDTSSHGFLLRGEVLLKDRKNNVIGSDENSTVSLSSLFSYYFKGKVEGSLFSISFKAVNTESSLIKGIVNRYVYTSSVIIVLSLAIHLWFSFKIENNLRLTSKSLCLFIPFADIFWSMYNIYSHFFFSNINGGFFYDFLPLIILFMLHIAIDMKVFVEVLETKFKDLTAISSITFLCLVLSFSSFLFKLRFFFWNHLIIFHSVVLLLPQIIFCVFNRGFFPPLIYLIDVMIYHNFTIVYLRCSKMSIFFHSDNSVLICFISVVIVLTSFMTIIVQFTLYSKYGRSNVSYYRSKECLKKECPKSLSSQCPICLNDLLSNDTSIKSDNISLSQGESCAKKKKSLLYTLFNYDEIKTANGEFIITPCNHIFHSVCLEVWLEVKNECPNCRRNINNIN